MKLIFYVYSRDFLFEKINFGNNMYRLGSTINKCSVLPSSFTHLELVLSYVDWGVENGFLVTVISSY